jgi:predicted DNA-binding transcriptional regulator AlpA
MKRATAVAEKPESADDGVLTLTEFCESYHISKPTFWRMRRAGTAPPIIQVSERRVVISRAAARAWRERKEAESQKQQ